MDKVMNDAPTVFSVIYIDWRGVVAFALVVALYAFLTWLGTRRPPPGDDTPAE